MVENGTYVIKEGISLDTPVFKDKRELIEQFVPEIVGNEES